MAFRNLAVPWLGGGLVVFGYAAFSWLRAKRAQRQSAIAVLPQPESVEPLSSSLERVPDELALDESEQLPANSNALPNNNPAVPASAALGALFLGRASEALSPFHFGPDWPTNKGF